MRLGATAGQYVGQSRSGIQLCGSLKTTSRDGKFGAMLAATGGQVPLWAALLIGLGGASLAVLIRIAYERGVEFRSRQLDAADDFLAHAFNFNNEVFAQWERHKEGGEDDAEIDAFFATLEAMLDKGMLIYARLILLGSKRTHEAGMELNHRLANLGQSLKIAYGRADVPPDVEPEPDFVGSAWKMAVIAAVQFGFIARSDLRQTWFSRNVGTLFHTIVTTFSRSTQEAAEDAFAEVSSTSSAAGASSRAPSSK